MRFYNKKQVWGGEIFDGLHNTSLVRKKLRAAGRRIGKTIENSPPAQNLRRTTPKPRPNHIEINIEIDTESDTETDIESNIETCTETNTTSKPTSKPRRSHVVVAFVVVAVVVAVGVIVVIFVASIVVVAAGPIVVVIETTSKQRRNHMRGYSGTEGQTCAESVQLSVIYGHDKTCLR